MTKTEFFKELKEELTGLSEASLSEILSDYEEHFSIAHEKGKSDAEVITKLGDPAVIAKEFKAQTLVKKAESHQSATNLWRAVFSTIGVSLFNLIFVVGPFIGVVATLFSFLIVGIALMASGLFATVVVIFSPVIPNISLGTSIAAGVLISLGVFFAGIFVTVLSYYLNKFFYKLTLKYLKFNLNIITKGV